MHRCQPAWYDRTIADGPIAATPPHGLEPNRQGGQHHRLRRLRDRLPLLPPPLPGYRPLHWGEPAREILVDRCHTSSRVPPPHRLLATHRESRPHRRYRPSRHPAFVAASPEPQTHSGITSRTPCRACPGRLQGLSVSTRESPRACCARGGHGHLTRRLTELRSSCEPQDGSDVRAKSPAISRHGCR